MQKGKRREKVNKYILCNTNQCLHLTHTIFGGVRGELLHPANNDQQSHGKPQVQQCQIEKRKKKKKDVSCLQKVIKLHSEPTQKDLLVSDS